MRFKNRLEAGKKLAEALAKYKGAELVVYALPRGGVVLGREIAQELGAPLDLIITRKIGHPLQSEYAVCAVAEDGDLICNEAERPLLNEQWLRGEIEREREEARRRREIYLRNRRPVSAKNKTAIVVDDGIATGLTMQLAIREVKHNEPERIVLAVPVIPAEIAKKFKKEVDEVVTLDTPELYLGAVGAYYDEFPQVEDEEVIKLLHDSVFSNRL